VYKEGKVWEARPEGRDDKVEDMAVDDNPKDAKDDGFLCSL
jgi:hypothetical protein